VQELFRPCGAVCSAQTQAVHDVGLIEPALASYGVSPGREGRSDGLWGRAMSNGGGDGRPSSVSAAPL
jgi:hypothetical protein